LSSSLVFAGNLKCELGILDFSKCSLNPATGKAWQVGDQYRLVFVSSVGTPATAPELATYDAFLQNLASNAGLGGKWQVLGSSHTVDAKNHTQTNPSSGAGMGIILIDGSTVIANNYQDLWDGSIDAPINRDELGHTNLNKPVYTGTNSNGTKRDRHLGGSEEVPPKVEYGNSSNLSGRWMVIYNSPATTAQSLYAISEPLTIRGLQTTISGTLGGANSWNEGFNWDLGVPTGEISVVIEKNIKASVNSSATPNYFGSLTLKENAILNLYDSVASGYAATSAALITLYNNAKLELNLNNDISLAPIELKGDAALHSITPKSDWQITNLSAIQGAHKFTLKGFNGHTFNLNGNNGFTEFVSEAFDRYRIYAKSAGALGLGDVTILGRADGRSAQLYLNVPNTIADTATLTLNGKGFDNNTADRITIATGVNEVVRQLVVGGVGMPAGVYNSSSPWLTGAGTLTVLENHVATGTISPGYIRRKLHWPYDLLKSEGENVPSFSGATSFVVQIRLGNLGVDFNTHKALQCEGLLYVPATDTYSFEFNNSSSISFNFYLDDLKTPLMSHSGLSVGNNSVQIYLKQGYHEFVIDAINPSLQSNVAFKWSSSQIPLSDITSAYLFHNSVALAKAQASMDSDGDGLSNLDETKYGTNPYVADSDGDGLTDREEIMVYQTNANHADSNQNGVSDFDEAKILFSNNTSGSVSSYSLSQVIAPSSYSQKTGSWVKEGDEIRSGRYRGSLSYNLELPESDMLVLEIDGVQEGNRSAIDHELALWVDDQYVGRSKIQKAGESRDNYFGMVFAGTLQITTPGLYTFYTNSDDV